jgi:hypothetical protein
MTPNQHKLAFIFATVLAAAALLAITTWAAVPKRPSDAAADAPTGTIYRPDLWKVY